MGRYFWRGRTRLRITATSAATAMEDPPKTVPTHAGNPAPQARRRALNARAKGDRETHERGIALRQAVAGKHDHTVHTDGREHANRGATDDGCGIDVSTAAHLGSRPAMSRMAAASVKTMRLTTLFSAIMPTFWPKVAVGTPPKSLTAYRPGRWRSGHPRSGYRSQGYRAQRTTRRQTRP